MSRHSIGFVLGLSLFVLLILLPPFDSFESSAEQRLAESDAELAPAELAHSMQKVCALLVLMVVWWLTEAIPLPATALLPAALLPLLHVSGLHRGGAVELSLGAVVTHYASPVIYLFLGGFLLAAAMRKWELDRRLTLWLLTRGRLADDARHILLAMMALSALLSMWISNTATTALMLPLGLGVLSSMGARAGQSRFGTALMLGIAWSASVGGIGTIIGTPPNGIALGILHAAMSDRPDFVPIDFLDWMLFGVPYVVLFIPVIWAVLLKIFPPESLQISGGRQRLLSEFAALGPLNRGAAGTIAVFGLAAGLWVLMPFSAQLLPAALARQLAWLDEYAVGILAGTLLFLIPVELKQGKFLLDWSDTRFVDWGTLILFGGGIALSDALFKTGLAAWMAASFVGLFGTPSTLVLMFAVVLLVDLLTEVTSNTAVTSMMVPIVISVAAATGESPVALTIATALAASMAFMLPVATPPNALVYSTGFIELKDMVRAGAVLDILGWLFTVAILVVFAGWLAGLF
ncbi:MAG TPA: DASS family sodium-coupled anion symporter [Acidobacteriota bacterium]